MGRGREKLRLQSACVRKRESWKKWRKMVKSQMGGESMIQGMLKLARKARLRCDKRTPKMDTDLLLKDADVKQFETTLTQQLMVAESITTTNGSMTGDEQWSKLKGALSTAAQAIENLQKSYPWEQQHFLEDRSLAGC